MKFWKKLTKKYGAKFIKRLIFNIIVTGFICYFFISIHLDFRDLGDRELREEKANKLNEEFNLNKNLDYFSSKTIDYTKTETSILRGIVYKVINLFLCFILLLMVWVSEQQERI